jgi:hypothetical protein
MPRFVLLYHDCPSNLPRASHWDLMLEDGEALATWALHSLPRFWSAAHERTSREFPSCAPLCDADCVAVTQLDRHRLAYLDYEGAVSNDRGRVARVAAGAYVKSFQSDDCVRFSCDLGLPAAEYVLRRRDADDGWELAELGERHSG